MTIKMHPYFTLTEKPRTHFFVPFAAYKSFLKSPKVFTIYRKFTSISIDMSNFPNSSLVQSYSFPLQPEQLRKLEPNSPLIKKKLETPDVIRASKKEKKNHS
jgi:hypothetical protein